MPLISISCFACEFYSLYAGFNTKAIICMGNLAFFIKYQSSFDHTKNTDCLHTSPLYNAQCGSPSDITTSPHPLHLKENKPILSLILLFCFSYNRFVHWHQVLSPSDLSRISLNSLSSIFILSAFFADEFQSVRIVLPKLLFKFNCCNMQFVIKCYKEKIFVQYRRFGIVVFLAGFVKVFKNSKSMP